MSNPVINRFYDLLIEQATSGLDDAGKAELNNLQLQLQREYPDQDWVAETEAIELTTAAVDCALAAPADTEMPAGMEQRLLQAIDHQPDGRESAELVDITQQLNERKASRTQWLGWYAAAASLVLAIYFGVERTEQPLPPDQQLESILQQQGTQSYAWATPTEPGYEQVSGDVIWNNETQQGFMRLVNLPQNDPAESQYQLWIVDPSRDQHPVDGGVFDVSGDGEVLIPIDAKLMVASPAAFAITREQPGGVVVSAGPLLVVAAVDA